MPAHSWLLPYNRFAIESKLTPGEVEEKLERVVTQGPLATFTMGRDVSTPYVGQLSKEGFRIQRFIRYRNSFLPIIKGTVEPTDYGARVQIMMRPIVFVIIFMGIWLGLVTCAGVVTLAAMTHGFQPVQLAPWGMFLFGVLLMNVGFGVEARKSERFLRALLPPRIGPVQVGPYR